MFSKPPTFCYQISVLGDLLTKIGKLEATLISNQFYLYNPSKTIEFKIIQEVHQNKNTKQI